MPGVRSVAVGVWVGAGARDEPDERAGVSHFLEHLLFKGSEQRSAHDISVAIDRVGGDMNAYTTQEYTAYYCRLPSQHVDLGLDLLAEVLTRPALREVDIEAERHVILEELRSDEDVPDDRVHTLLFGALFPDHALGRDAAGTVETVGAICPDDVRSFFGDRYRAGRFVLSVAGALDHDQVVARAEAAFRNDGPFVGTARVAPTTGIRPLVVDRRPTEQTHVAVGVRGVARDDPDREALDVLNHVMGGGLSSRLFHKIREERGLAYSVYSSVANYSDAGALTVYAGCAPAKLEEVCDLVQQEMDAVQADGVTGDELAIALGYLEGAYVLGLEDSGSRMARLGASLTTSGRIRTVEEQLDRYRAVTLADVRRVAERVLTTPRALAVVGPVTKKRVTSLVR